MGLWAWTAQNWFNLFSVAGIVGGFICTAQSLRSEAKTRRITNLLAITANHRELQKVSLTDKRLSRVRDASADIIKHPVTEAERVFVGLVIQHVGSVYYAMNDQLVVNLDGLRRDIAQFLSLPIPCAVWGKIKVVQNDDFVAFVEACRNWK